MTYFLLVLTWYTCALPSASRPCVESEVKKFSSEEDVARAYHRFPTALSRRVYRVKLGMRCDERVCNALEERLQFVLEPMQMIPEPPEEVEAKENFLRCRDANGITWESHGECD